MPANTTLRNEGNNYMLYIYDVDEFIEQKFGVNRPWHEVRINSVASAPEVRPRVKTSVDRVLVYHSQWLRVYQRQKSNFRIILE